jgi:hypothetical protein
MDILLTSDIRVPDRSLMPLWFWTPKVSSSQINTSGDLFRQPIQLRFLLLVPLLLRAYGIRLVPQVMMLGFLPEAPRGL